MHRATLIFDTTRLLQDSPTHLQSLRYVASGRYDVDYSRGDDELIALLADACYMKKLVAGEWEGVGCGMVYQG